MHRNARTDGPVDGRRLAGHRGISKGPHHKSPATDAFTGITGRLILSRSVPASGCVSALWSWVDSRDGGVGDLSYEERTAGWCVLDPEEEGSVNCERC